MRCRLSRLGQCLVAAVLLAGALPAWTVAGDVDGVDNRPVEAESLLGEPLHRPELPTDFRERQEALLAAARADLDAAPDDPEAAIWVGRRTAYLGRYREAIEIYGRAIDRHPDHAALLRHRGHRYITTRQLGEAIADLTRAAELTRGQPDEVEPDGLPNALGIPTSTVQGNIHYHLGLAHYLRGDFEAALAAYHDALEVSDNPDMLVATTYWLYMTLRRLGRDDEAATVLAPISADMEIIENHDYHRLLSVFRGDLAAESVWNEATESDALASATLGYGIGNWYLIQGDTDRARRAFEAVLAGPQWAAFGYIAAEAEWLRLASP